MRNDTGRPLVDIPRTARRRVHKRSGRSGATNHPAVLRHLRTRLVASLPGRLRQRLARSCSAKLLWNPWLSPSVRAASRGRCDRTNRPSAATLSVRYEMTECGVCAVKYRGAGSVATVNDCVCWRTEACAAAAYGAATEGVGKRQGVNLMQQFPRWP